MYINIDLEAPLQASYVRNSKVRNTLLNNWPRTTVDGHEVNDTVIIYTNNSTQANSLSSGTFVFVFSIGDIGTISNFSINGVTISYVLVGTSNGTLNFEPRASGVPPNTTIVFSPLNTTLYLTSLR